MEKDTVYRDVLGFIGRFSTNGKRVRQEVVEAFTCGCCWWFAYILRERFKDLEPRLMVDYVANHFGCEIGGEVYDITGAVTSQYQWEPWEDCEDDKLRQRIEEYCINF